MKIKNIQLLLAVAGALGATPQLQSAEYTAHEWGTFTSFQGGDGTLMSWKPLETAQLPGFVYDWDHAGLGRKSIAFLSAGGKGTVTSLQRMETPVIYFYADKELSVDVTVKFPQGIISEWYPQARQVGPSYGTMAAPTTGGTPQPGYSSSDSMIRWADVRVLAGNSDHGKIPALINDGSGTHYYAARDTDAATLVSPAYDKPGAQAEKFLFYRGVGNFTTPLRVVMKSDEAVNVANTGGEALTHLFVLEVRGNRGRFIYVPEVPGLGVKTVEIGTQPMQPLDELAEKLGGEMTAALAKTGLFPREASAMVNTWRDSWFKEPGVRVLYTMPRAWTDQTLPITLTPSPQALVRTMVGRAEVLAPGMEARLAALLEKAKTGDREAMNEARLGLKEFGRFAAPAFSRVVGKMNPRPEEAVKLNELLQPIQPRSLSMFETLRPTP